MKLQCQNCVEQFLKNTFFFFHRKRTSNMRKKTNQTDSSLEAHYDNQDNASHDFRKEPPDCGEIEAAHPESRYIFSLMMVIKGKDTCVGSAGRPGPPWNHANVSRIQVLLGKAPISTATQLHSNPRMPISHPYCLSGETTPTIHCLLHKFCQTGVESIRQVESNTGWHFPAHAVHHVGFWSGASRLQRH